MHSELPWPPFACSWRLAHIALPLPAARRKLTHCTWKSRKYRRLQMETWSASTGEGLFSIHPKTVSANGNFTHSDSQGNVLGSGTWVATQLLSFQAYGCGVVLGFPIPPNLCGGKLMLRVQLTSESGQFEGILSVFCIIGPNPPNSHDDESGEGARLDIIGVNNFNKIVSGGNVYIKTKLVLQVASTHLRPAPFASGHASNDGFV